MTVKYDASRQSVGTVSSTGHFTPLVMWKPESRVFVRRVESNHFFGKFKGYGLFCELVDYMKEKTTEDTPLYIVKNNTKTVYKTRLKDWKERGVEVNFGYGQQYVLPVKNMEEVNDNQP